MPPLVHSQAEQRLISLLGREVRIGKIGFSPWSLSADAPPPALTSAQRDAIVKRIYSDLATLECTPEGLRLIDAVQGLSVDELQRLVGLPIAPSPTAPSILPEPQ